MLYHVHRQAYPQSRIQLTNLQLRVRIYASDHVARDTAANAAGGISNLVLSLISDHDAQLMDDVCHVVREAQKKAWWAWKSGYGYVAMAFLSEVALDTSYDYRSTRSSEKVLGFSEFAYCGSARLWVAWSFLKIL